MSQIVRTADSKGRVVLPGFANATVIIERVDETEYRIRRAKVIAEKELRFHEENAPVELSARDAARLLETLDRPPAPKATARRAAKRLKKRYG